jgi:hypothetical protein
MISIVFCKHGVDLTQRECFMCKSLVPPTPDEAQELEDFFKKGIETIQGQRGRIKELEKKLKQSLEQTPIVYCGGCKETMGTCESRTRTEHTPYGATAYRAIEEVNYYCKTCGGNVWVSKLKGLI